MRSGYCDVVKIARLSGSKNFVGKRRFIFNALVDLKPVDRFEYRSDMSDFRSLNNSASNSFESVGAN